MARVKLALPKEYHFATELPIRVTDINYGGHLGNDAVLALFHEARIRFLRHCGGSEADLEGVGLIMSDAIVVYKSQAFLGETMRVEVAACEFARHRCDLFYRMTATGDGREIARGKTGIVFYNYATKRIAATPAGFRARCESGPDQAAT